MSLIESAEPLPGAVPLKPRLQKNWPINDSFAPLQPYPYSGDDASEVIPTYHKSDGNPIEIPPVQHSLVRGCLTEASRQAVLATDEELHTLINRIESMLLQRFIGKRKEAQDLLMSLRRSTEKAVWDGENEEVLKRYYDQVDKAHRKYREASNAINAMIQRGVKS